MKAVTFILAITFLFSCGQTHESDTSQKNNQDTPQKKNENEPYVLCGSPQYYKEDSMFLKWMESVIDRQDISQEEKAKITLDSEAKIFKARGIIKVPISK